MLNNRCDRNYATGCKQSYITEQNKKEYTFLKSTSANQQKDFSFAKKTNKTKMP